jgi:hypothetical protein
VHDLGERVVAALGPAAAGELLGVRTPLAIGLPQHAYQHRPEHPILLAVDQQLGEGPALRVGPELADPVGTLEVGKHEDVEKLGASRRREGLEALPERVLHLLEDHGKDGSTSGR